MSLRRYSKRMTTLNQEQIAYINGCATLQRAIWRLAQQDPLSALSSQIDRMKINKALYTLISIRDKSREKGLISERLMTHNRLLEKFEKYFLK